MRARGSGAAALAQKVAFDEPTVTRNDLGEPVTAYSEAHLAMAEFIFQKGDEVVQAARNAGRQVFKIRIRQCEAARAITTGYRMRDVRRGWPSGEGADSLPGTRYNITNVDAITDRGNVWLTVEGPVVS
ncbi:phage head completion protein [Marinovum algicola]|uniref:phage head completion protein n=1 Tax=Marinovum algicola TaxID=42444 RepID=UPI0024BA6D13|nr:head-tail adaptor protein [Marinovum algicola]